MSTIHGQPERVAGTVRTSVEDRATLPGAGAEAPTDRERRRGSPKPSPDQKSRRPRRGDPLTGRRSHSHRSHHKTRRGFNRCIHGQTTTAEENDPQNAIHGAGANRANLPRWTEAHRTPLKRRTSHIEPFLSILRTFTHKQINRA